MNLTPEQRQSLVSAAIEARHLAYAPYSNYKVGAAVLSTSGRVFSGANVENAAYPTSICAERVAIFKAVSEGEKEFEAIAVVTSNAGMSCGCNWQIMADLSLNSLMMLKTSWSWIPSELTVRDL